MTLRKTLLTACAALTATAGAARAADLMVPLYSWPSAWTEDIADCGDLPAEHQQSCVVGKEYWSRWQAVAEACSTTPVTVIINPASGPGALADGDPCDSEGSDWARGLTLLQGSGCHVLGYVATDYGRRDATELRPEVLAYRSACAETGGVDGIFFDEYKGSALTRADVRLANRWATHLRDDLGLDLVLNPGVPPQWAEGEASAGREADNPYADVPLRAIVTTEDTAAAYMDQALPQWHAVDDPARHALLLHGVDPTDLLSLLERARSDGFGHVFMTDGADPDPWRVQPSFWSDLVSEARSPVTVVGPIEDPSSDEWRLFFEGCWTHGVIGDETEWHWTFYATCNDSALCIANNIIGDFFWVCDGGPGDL